MVLSAAGRTMVGPARQIVRDMDAVDDLLSASADELTGHLEILAFAATAVGPVVDLVARFRAAYPRVSVRLGELRDETRAASAIEDGHCEFAVAHLPIAGDDLEVIVIGEHEHVLVYPPGTDWLDDGRLAPLRLGQDERQAQWSTEALSRDLVNALVRTGGTSTTPEGAREVTGTVRGVVGGRGLVELDGGGSAVLWPELVAPGVPAERIVAPGQRVTGWFDATRGRVDVTPDAGEHAAWWRARVPGEVVLARVAEVSDATMELEPAPGVTVAVGLAQVTGNAGAVSAAGPPNDTVQPSPRLRLVGA